MNKVLAKVKILKEKNVEHLIKAFFRNFNPESSINIKGDKALLEIVFDKEPPLEIVEAISFCEVEELFYGKDLTSFNEEEKETIGTNIVNEEDEVNKEDASYEPPVLVSEKKRRGRPPKKEKKKVVKKATTKRVVKKVSANKEAKKEHKDVPEIPVLVSEKKRRGRPPKSESRITTKIEVSTLVLELNEIAAKVKSLEEFGTSVADWLEMKQRTEFFKNLVLASMQVDKFTWTELENILKSNKVKYTSWDKIWAGKQVTEKLKGRSITIIKLLEEVSLFKDYWNKKSKKKSKTTSTSKEVKEEMPKEEENDKVINVQDSFQDKPKIKMDCMPEIKDFEEVLASVDKTQPVEKRTAYVLEAMGLESLPTEVQKQILEITNTAVTYKNISFDKIFVKANIPIEKTMEVRMTFSKFINDFAQKYEKDKKVKLLTFLNELQKIIMFEDEVERFDDFGNSIEE